MAANDSEARFALSFTDVLTCVFGAAILLLLIFAIIVIFDPIVESIDGETSAVTDQDLSSIQDAILSGYATSTLRVLSPSTAMIAAIDWELDHVDTQIPLRVEVSGQTFEGRQIEFTKALDAFSLRFIGNPDWDVIGDTRLVVTLAVGGLISCLDISVSQDQWEAQGAGALADVNPESAGFLRSDLREVTCE